MKKQIISTKNAPSAVGPYVQGIKAGNTVYVSGQLGIDVALGKLPDTLEAQAHASMKNLGAILKEAGASYGDIVKTTIFIPSPLLRGNREATAGWSRRSGMCCRHR